MDLNQPTSISVALRRSGIDPLDAEVLLCHIFGKPRAWLLANENELLSKEQERTFQNLLARRKKHEPVAYILGEKEFYGRTFFVDRRVMIPRPATEVLIDEVKRVYTAMCESDFQYVNILKVNQIIPADNEIVIFTCLFSNKHRSTVNGQLSIVDIGTGSGCIGITLALEFPDVKVICTDISELALEVAKENAKRHGVVDRVKCTKINLLNGVMPSSAADTAAHIEASFLIVSNPPYIPEVDASRHFRAGSSVTPLPPDVLNYEPHEALFAGSEGMDVLKPLFAQCREHPLCIGCVLECRQEQAKKLTKHS